MWNVVLFALALVLIYPVAMIVIAIYGLKLLPVVALVLLLLAAFFALRRIKDAITEFKHLRTQRKGVKV
jgi:hypothetical protein